MTGRTITLDELDRGPARTVTLEELDRRGRGPAASPAPKPGALSPPRIPRTKPSRLPAPELPGRFASAGGSFIGGATDVVASVPESIAIAKAGEERQMAEAFNAIDRGKWTPQPDQYPTQMLNVLGNYQRGDAAIRQQLRSFHGAVPGAGDPRESGLYKAGQGLRDVSREAFAINPKHESSFLFGQLPRGAGSTLGFAATGLLTRGARLPAMVGAAGTGAAVGASGQFRDALGAGASIEDATRAAGFGALAGTSEAAPIARVLDRYDKATGGSVRRLIVEGIKGGAEEAAQEIAQTIADNLIASRLVKYDPERGTFEGTGEAGGVGFTVGGLFSFVAAALGGRRARRDDIQPQPPEEPAAPRPVADVPAEGQTPEAATATAAGPVPSGGGEAGPFPRGPVAQTTEPVLPPRQSQGQPQREDIPTQRIVTARGRRVTWRGPMDMVTFLRASGGIQDQGGELRALGVSNARRHLPFSGREHFIGGLVKKDGLLLDDAAFQAWAAGYMPESTERPTINEFLAALDDTYRGLPGRRFHPDDWPLIEAMAERDVDEEAAHFGVDISAMTEAEADQAIEEARSLREGTRRTVTLEDLDRSAPPQGDILSPNMKRMAGNLDRANRESTETRAGNINLDRLESVGDIRRALKFVADNEPRVPEATRGKVSQAETARVAEALGMDANRLRRRRRGQAFNAGEAVAARRLLAQSGEDLVRTAKAARGGGDADLLAFQRAYYRHLAIQEQVAGMTAEAGRALASFKITAQSEAAREAGLKAAMDAAGGRDKIENIAKAISELDNPAAVAKFARDSFRAKLSDKLLEAWINALLSGPRTHAVNVTSNTITALWALPENVIAAGIGKFHRGDRVTFNDTAARAYGFVQGAREGLRLAKNTFVTEEPSDRFSKIEARRYRAIGGRFGKMVRLPGRFLIAEDEFFKAIGYRMELNALAVRQASQARLKGRAFAERVEAIKADPPESLQLKAMDTARYQTFTRPLGRAGQSVQAFARALPVARLIIPFIRTPTNILKFATARSPFAPMMREVRDELRAGGATRDLAMARIMLGSSIAAVAASLAAEGLITGGPSDPRERAALFDSGWRPYSVKIGDGYYSYGRLEPLGMIVGISADFADIAGELSDEEREHLGAIIVTAISRNLTSKTWLRGLSDMIEATADPERYGDRYIQRMAGTVVPTITAQIARTRDPTLREVRTIMDAIKARIPGYSETLPPRRNVWGEPIVLSGGLGPDIVSPTFTGRDRHDAVADEVVRLKLRLSKVPRKIAGSDLTPRQYEEFQVMAGRPAKKMLDRLVVSAEYTGKSDGVKVRMIRRVLSDIREAAREEMLRRHPNLARDSAKRQVRELLPATAR